MGTTGIAGTVSLPSHHTPNPTEAIDANPGFGKAYRARGTVYGKLGRQDESARDLAKAERLKARRGRPGDVSPESQ